MNDKDLADICQIAALCHPDFPEEQKVLDEKRVLSPDTCFVLQTDIGVGGYMIAHPYLSNQAPALNCFLVRLPEKADTLYLHDIAIAPFARFTGAASQALVVLKNMAQAHGFKSISLIAVNGSPPFWKKHGFKTVEPSLELKQKLLSYSDDALYMVCTLAQDMAATLAQ